MPVYLVVTDDSFPLDKIKKKFPSDFVEVFGNAFLISYELSDWSNYYGALSASFLIGEDRSSSLKISCSLNDATFDSNFES